MKSLQRSSIVLTGSANRVLGRMFIPGEEDLLQGTSRIPQVIERVMHLTEEDVVHTLRAVEDGFRARHRDLRQQFDAHFRAVSHLAPDDLTTERQALIGAYFTQEYAIEGAAYFNPSIAPMPDEPDHDSDILRFVMSVRAVGEGHISTIVFRTGSISGRGDLHVDQPSPYASTRAERFTILRSRLVRQAAMEAGVDSADLELVLGMLPDKFTPEELLTSLTQVDLAGLRHSPSQGLIDTMNRIAASSYEVDFPWESELSERVLWPTAPDERRGMEDARFVRLLDPEEPVRYRASYTAFDGSEVRTRILETDDFRSFSSMSLTGPGVRNKGLAFFPRRIDGSCCAVSRHDRESVSLAYSTDGYHWNDVRPLVSAQQPWELVHMGNCGSPIETDDGWLVLTHGAGPMREYCIGALLLDRNDPARVIGRLTEPLLRPEPDERDGYVPNVVYSCGSLVHRGILLIPYGFSDWRIRFAMLDLEEVLNSLM